MTSHTNVLPAICLNDRDEVQRVHCVHELLVLPVGQRDGDLGEMQLADQPRGGHATQWQLTAVPLDVRVPTDRSHDVMVLALRAVHR